MYRTKDATQKRKDEKRQLILDTAARVFSAKGYHNASITDIVNEAHISVGSMYFYFKSKEELFCELYKNIVEQFNDTIDSVLDVQAFPLLKNYTRVMTATLYMYEQKRDVAKIILLEANAINPEFDELEKSRIKGFAEVMTDWFRRFKLHSEVYIPDERVAALAFAGSFNYLVNDWLSTDGTVALTEYAYPFCVYNLQALRIPFEENTVKGYIEETLAELSNKE